MASSSSIIVRLRGPDGSFRVQVPTSGTLRNVAEELASKLSCTVDEVALYADAGNKQPLSDLSLTLTAAGIKEGDFVFFLKESIPPALTRQDTHSRLMPVETPSVIEEVVPPKKKCDHSSNTRCINCMDDPPVSRGASPTVTGGRGTVTPAEAGTIKHPSRTEPMAKISKPDSGATAAAAAAPRCTHGPHVRCINCPVTDRDASMPEPRQPHPACRAHGPKGRCMHCMDKVEMIHSQDERYCEKLSFANERAFRRFEDWWYKKQYKQQRCGILYGTFDHVGDKMFANVHVVYEPPQISDADAATMLQDGASDVADLVAAHLGLQRVGFIYTRLPSGSCDMSASDVMRAAAMQNKYGGYFTTCVMTLDDTGVPSTSAYQVSKQCMAFQRDGIFLQSSNPDELATRSPVIVGGTETKSVPPFMFMVPVRIAAEERPFLHSQFPIDGRPEFTIEPDTLNKHLTTFGDSLTDSLTDFGVLMYLARFLDLQTQLLPLCDCVKERKPIPEPLQQAIYAAAGGSVQEHPLRVPEGVTHTLLAMHDGTAAAAAAAALGVTAARATPPSAGAATRSLWFPESVFVRMEKADVGKVREKLFEFNARVAASPSSALLSLTPAEYETLGRVFGKLTSEFRDTVTFTPSEVTVVQKMLRWPDAFLFPALDTLRLLLLVPNWVDKMLLDDTLRDAVCRSSAASQPGNMLVGMWLLMSWLSTPALQGKAISAATELLKTVGDCVSHEDRRVRAAAASALLNWAVLLNERYDKSIRRNAVTLTVKLLQMATLLPDAALRALVALGTLTATDDDSRRLAIALLAPAAVRRLVEQMGSEWGDVRRCAADVVQVLVRSSS